MSWHFSQALEAAYLEENSSDGQRFVPWKSIPSALDDSCSAKMKDTFHRSPYGTMFAPSMDGPGMALLTWFQEVFLARTYRVLEKELESQGNGQASGRKWPGSFAKYDPNTSSWKTAQYSLFEDFDARWGVLGAHHAGAPHLRERIWILANSNLYRWKNKTHKKQNPAITKRYFFSQWWGKLAFKRLDSSFRTIVDIERMYKPKPNGMDDGLATIVDRINAIGNGQVPAVVKLAFETLTHNQPLVPTQKTGRHS